MSDIEKDSPGGSIEQSRTVPTSPAVALSPDDVTEQVNVPAIVWTIGVSAAAVVVAHLIIGINYVHDRNNNSSAADWNLPWQVPVATALSLVSLVSFGGFYVAARRARIAIASSFLLTFLVMLPFALTIPNLGDSANTELAKTLLNQFGGVVSTLIVFYFGSEAVISGLKLWTTSQNPDAAPLLAKADRDLPSSPK